MSTHQIFSITIAIVSHEQASLVERLLKSLETHKPDLELMVVVLENKRNQPKINIGAYNFKINYLHNQAPESLSSNINRIFQLYGQHSDYFCILNPDILFEQEVFSGLIDAMKSHQIDIIAPLAVNTKGAIQDSFRALPKPKDIILRYLSLKKLNYDYESLPVVTSPDWIAAMFLLMPSKIFHEIGGFNPRYRLYFEDVDFCIRARLNNYSIGVIKSIKVTHDGQRASHRKPLYLYHHVISAIKFFLSKEYRAAKNISHAIK